MSRRRRIILSGGGTGGHIYPAIAVADALKEIDPDIDILFVGAKGRMEMEKVPEAGYSIEGLWISGFQRKITIDNLLFPLKLASSLWRAGSILGRFKPDLAIGFGGYASGPLLQMAVRKGVRTAIQEQNAFPGATNRLLARQVDKVFTAYPDMTNYFASEKTFFTGNPVRNALLESQEGKTSSRDHFGLSKEKLTVLVFGGSLGAGVLNEAMDNAFSHIRDDDSIQWIWQTGQFYKEKYRNSATAGLKHVKQVTFLNRMDMAYAAADLVVCRAGALTISELSVLGKSAILVPSPHVAEDHQTKNALALEKENAAVYLSETKAKYLIEEAISLVRDEHQLKNLSENIKRLAKPNASKEIAKHALALIT